MLKMPTGRIRRCLPAAALTFWWLRDAFFEPGQQSGETIRKSSRWLCRGDDRHCGAHRLVGRAAGPSSFPTIAIGTPPPLPALASQACGLLRHGLARPRLCLVDPGRAGASPAKDRGDRASIGMLRCVSRCRCHTSCVAIGSEFDPLGRRSSVAFAKHRSSRPTAVQSAHRTFCEAGHSLESMARSARPRTGRKCRHRYLL
jgi:hypothetical protein